MGTCLALMEQVEEAIPFFHKSIDILPSPDTYYSLAEAHRFLLNIKEYASCLEKAIELDGRNGETGRKAKKDLDELRAFTKKNSGITLEQYFENMDCFDLAFEHLRQGRYKEAVLGFSRILDTEPKHVQTHGNLGLAYAGLGEMEKALDHLDRAIQLDPDYEPAIQNRRTFSSLKPGERFDVTGHFEEVEFYSQKIKTGKSPAKRNFFDRLRNKR